ncbi:cadherin-like beta sandwich domain-containing protein, partial [Bacteroidales bacterium OttesenSCG-928-L14]|nr:cadherin-like beta sandwich domain-containing protein [Bacteroidales bacterium OttesenSCG-928-L14]
PEGNLILSYQDSYPRSYYQPYDAIMNPNGYTGGDNGYERTEREHQLLANAIVAVENTIPENLNIDYNNDGDVDNICFIVKGSPGEWNTLLWPHKWALYSYDVEIHGKFVWEYNMQIETHLDNSKASVLSHEMFHSLGAPDYYHYSHDGLTPVGQWDLMAGNTLPPQSPLAYTKWKYGGWIDDIPTITVDGTYTLNNVWADENCAYKILSPNSSSEYFVIEFRDTDIFWDSSIPGTGVLIYRINSNENGNSQGPPDEVYIYRPGGDLYNDGDIYLAHYGVDDRTEISDDTSPSCFLSYGGQGGIHIYNITINDNGTASFTIGEAAANDATLSALSISDGSLTPQFSPNITEYMVSVGNSVNNITITAIANNPLASVSGDGTHPLNIGENPFDIIVTAEDGETTKTYTVNVNRSDIIYYDIISSVDGTNGIIDPLGNNSYIEGSDVTYTMTPDNGYIIDKVLIDNNEVVITDNTYTFEDISSNHSIVVKFKLFVGIEDFTNQIKIYPNPAKNNVTIESSEEINNITIFDSFGKKIFERGNINEKSLMIDVNNYSVGIYYITVDGKTEKLIVK